MKRNTFKRLMAAFLSAVMVCGMVMPSFAANAVAEQSDTVSEMLENVAPFTSTEDLIDQVKEQVFQEGQLMLPKEEDQSLAQAVEAASDYSYEQAKSMLSHAFFTHREGAEGQIDTARLNLSEATMEALVQVVLEEAYLEETVQVSYEVEDGIVTVIHFTMRESFAQGLDEIQVTNTETWTTPEGTCTHENIAHVEYQAATCDQPGNKPHFYCADCDSYFASVWSDTANDYVPGGERTKAEITTTAPHSLDEVAKTETVQAHYKCSVCGNLFADAEGQVPTTLEELSKCPHSEAAFVPTVDATCEADGTRAHFACECGVLLKAVSDGNGGYKAGEVLDEAGVAALTIPASHKVEAVEETATQIAHFKCALCGELFLDATGTTPTDAEGVAKECDHRSCTMVPKVDATCDTDGMKAHYDCNDCDAKLSITNDGAGGYKPHNVLNETEVANLVIPAAHTLKWVAGTETHIGHYQCSVCGDLFRDEAATQPLTEEELIRPCEHGSYKLVEKVEPDCENPGSEAYYLCNKCGAYFEVKTSSSGSTYAGAALTEEQIEALVIPATGHEHVLVDAVWAPAYVYYTDNGQIDGNILNMNPDPYGAPYIIVDVDGVPTQISTMALVYDPATKSIGYAPAVALYNWTCTELIVGCPCGETTSITDNIQVTSYVCDDAFYAANPTANFYDYDSTIFDATYTGPEGTFTASLNGTKRQLMDDWAVLCKFNADHPEYFGAPAPYWTSKNTEQSPLGAMKWLTNMQEEDFIPDNIMQYMVSMLTQAFMSYVLQYGDMLTAMKEDALESVSIGMTDIQIYLMLHEWIAKYATFDMQSMVDQMSGGSAGSDPITMTAFGTLLADQLNLNGVGDNGGVCLGYAATYVWLVQSAFKEMGRFGENTPYSYFIENPVVDFVQIKYLTNVEDASVADGDSGFGAGDVMFNAPHFFNAVKALNTGTGEYNWYYVDAAYDDINVETISQYRVETDGNISHGNFMLSPVSMEKQYEGKFQFLDSLYDGATWERVPYLQTDDEGNLVLDDNGQPIFLGWYRINGEGQVLTPKEAEFYEKYEKGQTFYYYQRRELTDAEKAATGDYLYDDETYEQTWFSNVISEIIFDKNSGAFYYVEGQGNSYASMKDMLEDDDENGFDIFESMSMSDMNEYMDDPAYADEMRARPIGASDLPSDFGEPEDDNDSFMGSFDMYEDEESIVIFHYGFGTYGREAQNSSDEHGGDFSFGQEDEEDEYTEEDFGPFYQELLEDKKYHDMYPELSHSVIVYDGVLYFNLGTKIFTYNLSRYSNGTYTILNEDGQLQFPRGEISQLKEYNEVTFGSDGRRFAGMSFHTDPSVWTDTMVDGNPVPIVGPATIYEHPISALCVKSDIKWNYEIDPETGMVIARYRDLVPTMYVSIGTNFSNSYKGASGVAYAEEAVNYNPDYLRFMDDNKDDNENTNTEFMWCANVVDKMVMETLLGDTDKVTVTVGATCDTPGFTEERSAIYGLSDGTKKVVNAEDPAHYHHYEIHPMDKTLVCTDCLKAHDATIEQTGGTSNNWGNDNWGNGNNYAPEEPDYIDTHKHTVITKEDVTFEWYTKEDGTQGCRAKLYCEEEFCDRNSTWHECEVTGEEGAATATVTIVVQDVDSKGEITESTLTFTGFKGVLGDVNQDGKVNIFDVARLRLAVENRATDDLQMSTSDVNCDGKIDIFDVARLRLHIESRGQVALG